MPYIKQDDRDRAQDNPDNAGELNYALTRVVLRYIARHGESYQLYNDIMGALEGCKFELYRRAIGRYEDRKINMNGDVY